MAKKSPEATTTTEAPAKKNPCPITREQFSKDAPSHIRVRLGNLGQDGLNVDLVAMKKEFSSNSFGWYLGDKVTVYVGETPIKVQVGLNLTVVGSKDVAK